MLPTPSPTQRRSPDPRRLPRRRVSQPAEEPVQRRRLQLLQPRAVCCCIFIVGCLLQGAEARLQMDTISRLRLRRDASGEAAAPSAAAANAVILDPTVRHAVIKHLHKYAYLPNTDPSDEDLRKALKAYQAVAGVPITGEADAATVAATRAKRCSRPDAEPAGGPSARAKRYALPIASKWNPKHFAGHKLTLKWYISKYTNDMERAATRKTIQKGFDIWAKQTHIPQFSDKSHQVTLEFEEAKSEGEADINIRWEEGQHGDKFPFDGDGDDNENVLAHTFYPDYKPFPLNGDIHFDDAEKWSLTVGVNTFFPYVLVHEIGHALGLQHSHSSLAVMNPHYKDIPVDAIQLHADDKCGVNWNIVGPTNWCLFVWLTSEIVPIHSQSSSGVGNTRRSSRHDKVWSIKRQLWHTQLPLCADTNDVRADLLVLLSKQLHFSESDAILYGEICCRFLDGLDKYRSRIGEYAHKLNDDVGRTKEFVSSADDGKQLSRRALHRFASDKPSILDENHFDLDFFDAFFAEY